jgi:hypothetical protein
MKIKQVRVAQAIRGETSNLIESTKYNLNYDKGILYVELKNNPKGFGKFMVFPANIAYLEYEEISLPAEESPEVVPAVVNTPQKSGKSKK